jgi:hypothetical protein
MLVATGCHAFRGAVAFRTDSCDSRVDHSGDAERGRLEGVEKVMTGRPATEKGTPAMPKAA